MTDTNYRLLPVALHPAIEEALKAHVFMPKSAWRDVMQAWDRVRPDDAAASEGWREETVTFEDAVNQILKPHVSGYLRPGLSYRIARLFHERNRPTVAAPGRSGKTADEYPIFQHPDDSAVDRFAVAMKAKMTESRAKGRSGWDNEVLCTGDTLRAMLNGHIDKGDPVDVGNFAMMLFNRKESTTPAASSSSAPSDVRLRDAILALRPALPTPNDGANYHREQWFKNGIEAAAALATPSVQAVAAGQELTPEQVYAIRDSIRWGDGWDGDNWDVALANAVRAYLTKPPALAGDTQAVDVPSP